MEQTEMQNNEMPSYWASVGIAAFIFSLITFVIQLISGYMQINAEPSGSMFPPGAIFGTIACLVGAFGGMVAVWHYAREYDITMKLGKGAIIGLATGCAMVLIGLVLNELWGFIDPDMAQKTIDSMVANYEAMDLPEETKQQMIDSVASQADPSVGRQLLFGIPLFGILNLLTGLIGVAIFAREKDNI